MKKTFRLFTLTTSVCFLLACANDKQSSIDSDNKYSYDEKMAPINSEEPAALMDAFLDQDYSNFEERATVSSSAKNLNAIVYSSESNVTDTMKNLIRTADIKFRVGNIVRATLTIEDIVNGFGGYIEDTKLYTTINNKSVVRITADSVESTNYCTARNTITIRIPSNKFNTIIKEITPLVDYLDYRNLESKNVTIDIIRQHLAQKRAALQGQRLQKAVDSKPNKLDDVIGAESVIAFRQEQEDNAKIDKMVLNDKIAFSTIRIQIYQNNIVDVEKRLVEQAKNEYKPSFGSKAVNSLNNGWQVLQGIVLFIIDIWSILLIVLILLVILLIYRRYRKAL